ncbi:MAG TPA: hypothetical protein VJS37_02715 [Terriglobales bacterium]|nr:hypothetical protein [Terriglobales bacterium]
MRHGFPKRFWIVPFLVVAALVAAHGVALYQVASRLTWTILLAVVVLVLLTHSGLLGSIYAMFLRRSKRKS